MASHVGLLKSCFVSIGVSLLLIAVVGVGSVVDFTLAGLATERALLIPEAEPSDMDWIQGMADILPEYSRLRWNAWLRDEDVVPLKPHYQAHAIRPGQGTVIRVLQRSGSMFRVSDSLQYNMLSIYLESPIAGDAGLFVVPQDALAIYSGGYYGGNHALGFASRGTVEVQNWKSPRPTMRVSLDIPLYGKRMQDSPQESYLEHYEWAIPLETATVQQAQELVWSPTQGWPAWADYERVLRVSAPTQRSVSGE